MYYLHFNIKSTIQTHERYRYFCLILCCGLKINQNITEKSTEISNFKIQQKPHIADYADYATVEFKHSSSSHTHTHTHIQHKACDELRRRLNFRTENKNEKANPSISRAHKSDKFTKRAPSNGRIDTSHFFTSRTYVRTFFGRRLSRMDLWHYVYCSRQIFLYNNI